MLRIREVKLPVDHTPRMLRDTIVRILGIDSSGLLSYRIHRQSVDARQRGAVALVYIVDAEVKDENRILLYRKGALIEAIAPEPVPAPVVRKRFSSRPIIVGTGPAGLFAGLALARAGANPILLERGKPVEERIGDVVRFMEQGILNPQSNIQFGEGGAGTFSDGKLTTLINDPHCRAILRELVAAGAPEEILYTGKPHIGTDVLRRVVVALRTTIQNLGGEFLFKHQLTGLAIEDGKIVGAVVNGSVRLETKLLILAIGNGSRDAFSMLHEQGIPMTSKPFSIGVRIEHPREMIDRVRYGRFAGHPRLGAADYKLVHHCGNGLSVYTFCMCPGGVVVAAASEPEALVTNGMSWFARDRENSNSALLVGVTARDFGSDHPLAGVDFQRRWERKAFELGGKSFRAPVQLVGDLLAGRPSKGVGQVTPSYRPGVAPADLRECLPPNIIVAFRQALPALDRKLPGFAMEEAVLTGVETRSSSPVRILRDEQGMTAIAGLYAIGEGAGYAGGIMSAAVDGMRLGERLAVE